MPPVDPFARTLSSATMKSICKWADKNKDELLTINEIDKARERLSTMKLSTSQKQWYKQQHKAVPENYLAAFGHYLEAARAGADKPYYLDDLGPVFRVDQLDVISGYDNKLKDISSKDWEEYMKPPIAYY